MTNLLDASTFIDPGEIADFTVNLLEASTEYSIIGKDLDGRILLFNEGAHRLYGYEPSEVVGKLSDILHAPADVAAGLPATMRAVALADGKWEGAVLRKRKDGSAFTARVVLTPRRNAAGEPIGYLLISKDISSEIRLTEELEATQFYTRSLLSVADTGVGITPENQSLLFRAFEQVGDAKDQKFEGTGLGLYISQKLAGLLGGVIAVQSAPGTGSTFTLSLPAA